LESKRASLRRLLWFRLKTSFQATISIAIWITSSTCHLYVTLDLTDTLNYFGSANSKLIEQDFTREQGQDFTVRKEILEEFPDATDNSEIYRRESALIIEHGANDPSKGYNRNPKFRG
jgi:hypothetical protein